MSEKKEELQDKTCGNCKWFDGDSEAGICEEGIHAFVMAYDDMNCPAFTPRKDNDGQL